MLDRDHLAKQVKEAQDNWAKSHRSKRMNVFVGRNASTDDGTPGILTVDGSDFTCKTLELPWKNNETGVSCILPDTYNMSAWFSPSLGRKVFRLEDKHGRQNCLIHNANFAGEAVGDETQVHGCTAVGDGYGQLQNDEGNMQLAILHSVVTLQNLINAIGDGPHQITYSWDPGCVPADTSDHQTQDANVQSH